MEGCELLKQHIALIKTLYTRTLSGQAHWSTTSASDQYQLRLTKSVIVLARRNPTFSEGLLSPDHYMFVILDEAGTKVDEFDTGPDDESHSQAEELYDFVHRRVLGIDQFVAEVLDELNSATSIGQTDGSRENTPNDEPKAKPS
jgi:hypothetical protein